MSKRLRRYRLPLRTDKTFFRQRRGSRTFLRPYGHDGAPLPPARGAGWHITFERQPSDYKDDPQVHTEPVLHAVDFAAANRVALLIYGAHSVLQACLPRTPFFGFDPYRATPLDEGEKANMDPHDMQLFAEQGPVQTPDVERACYFAASLSRDLSSHYACLKLLLSFRDCSLPTMSLHPDWGQTGLVQSDSPYTHLLWARAIVDAYGAIEELGLAVRASPDKPSIQNGNWNPSVRADIEDRLRKRRINLDDRITWFVRGPPRKIERLNSSRLLSQASMSWSEGPYVRDSSVQLVDAINAASRLRSKVAAHSQKGLRSRLSPVDVHNVQMVARRLLMESFRQWRNYTTHCPT